MRGRIGVHFIFAVGTITVGIMLVFAWILLRNQREQLLDAKIACANQLSETIKKSTRHDMMANHLEDVFLIIQTIGKQRGIEKVRVFEKSGTIIFSTLASETGSTVDMRAEACYACHASDQPIERVDIPDRTRIFHGSEGYDLLGIINPIYNEPACYNAACHYHPPDQRVLGVLDITMSLADMNAVLHHTRIQTLMSVIAAFLALSLLIFLFVRRRILRPVENLVEACNRVASGDFSRPVEIDQNDELGLLARSFNDMTDRLTEAQMQISQSDKLASIGRLAAGFAHEINSPLTGILTYSSFLLKRADEVAPATLTENLQVIVRETKRCREIVRGLLDFARQSDFALTVLDMNTVVRRALEILGSQMERRGITLDARLADGLPPIRGDGNQLQQVVVNILVNAMDAVGRGGRILVMTRSIRVPPRGNVQVHRALCPQGCSLTDESKRIHNLPAVKVGFRTRKTEGVLYLDPLYGGLNHLFSRDVNPEETLEITCGKCGVSIVKEGSSCPECGAPLFAVATPEEGEVLWCTRRGCPFQRWEAMEGKGDRLYVETVLQDDGPGIEPDFLGRIFEPFYTTKGKGGTGLGLAITWGIVNRHKGIILVESEPGSGTTFTVRLPALAPDEEETDVHSEAGAPDGMPETRTREKGDGP